MGLVGETDPLNEQQDHERMLYLNPFVSVITSKQAISGSRVWSDLAHLGDLTLMSCDTSIIFIRQMCNTVKFYPRSFDSNIQYMLIVLFNLTKLNVHVYCVYERTALTFHRHTLPC
jgi:hypothetical protein